jgi:DNA (cytosine-5)-methyltransferase 1
VQPRAYYNELDPYAADWLRNLIAAGHIAAGDVDQRSIADVRPDDLRGYTQCHFFAGIGVWSYALRLAGWPDDRPVWTGSCPCQPFSAAGKRQGFADDRHLWPVWARLIAVCRPVVVFGEQVTGPAGERWLDLVHADLETMGYAVGAVVLPAAGVGAPHGRHRLFFVADAVSAGRPERRAVAGDGSAPGGSGASYVADAERYTGVARRLADEPGSGARPASAGPHAESGRRGDVGLVADADGGRRERPRLHVRERTPRPAVPDVARAGAARGMADANGGLARDGDLQRGREHRLVAPDCGATRGFWRHADWLWCRDNAYRPVEPGTFPLAHGAPARVGRLRAYGNAIVPQVAEAFIRAYGELTTCK